MKVIDLSVLIESGIDCEFWDKEYPESPLIGTLNQIISTSCPYQMKDHEVHECCRPRMNHIHAWQGGECPLPEGVMVKFWRRAGGRSVLQYEATTLNWERVNIGYYSDIIAFEVTGLAEGWQYPWEPEDVKPLPVPPTLESLQTDYLDLANQVHQIHCRIEEMVNGE